MNINKEITNLKVVLAYLEAKAALLEPEEETTEKWYHSIPKEGVLCYVDDNEDHNLQGNYMHKVYSYNYGAEMPFVTTKPDSKATTIAWTYATPVQSN
jgi:hypothetical protein